MSDVGDRVARAIATYKAEAGVTTDLFVDEAIPPKKLANARQACRVPESEPVRALLDCTLFGSAKYALIFGAEAVYLNSSAGEGRIPYAELPGMALADGANKQLRLGDDHVLDASGCSVPIDKVIKLLGRVQRAVIGEAEASAWTAAAPPADMAAAVVRGLERYRTHPEIGEKLHIGAIPEKILVNARRGCGLAEAEPVLAVVDLTVMGSGSDYLVFTVSAMHVGGARPARLTYADLPRRAIEARFAQVMLGDIEIRTSVPKPIGGMLMAVVREVRGGAMDNIVFHSCEITAGMRHLAVIVTLKDVIILDGGPIDLSPLTAIGWVRFKSRIEELARTQNLDGLLALDDPHVVVSRSRVVDVTRLGPKKVALAIADAEGIVLELGTEESADGIMAALGSAARA